MKDQLVQAIKLVERARLGFKEEGITTNVLDQKFIDIIEELGHFEKTLESMTHQGEVEWDKNFSDASGNDRGGHCGAEECEF